MKHDFGCLSLMLGAGAASVAWGLGVLVWWRWANQRARWDARRRYWDVG